jgi:hypothetical protein
MMNYHQISTEATERQQLFLAEAEQRRLAQLVPAQPHPLMAWVGQRLIGWGQRLQAEKRTTVWPVTPVALAQ